MKPAIIEAEVDIDRSPADVLDYCSDHRHEPEWNPMMKRIEKVTDGYGPCTDRPLLTNSVGGVLASDCSSGLPGHAQAPLAS